MTKIKCIAIDDEPMALEVIKEYIEKVPYLCNLGLFENAFAANDFLKNNSVDLVFLDLQMPDISGFQFLKLQKTQKLTIMTTAYAKYALQGYEFEVVDYLLKPISFQRFTTATEKALKRWTHLNYFLTRDGDLNLNLQIKSGHAHYHINPKDLIFIEGNGNYLNFHTIEKKILSLMKMDEALALLPSQFKRIHKSYIVNIDRVTLKTKRFLIINGKKLPISKTYKSNI